MGDEACLASRGNDAQIAVQTKAPPELVCPGGTVPTITFDPASIPRRDKLVISPGQPGAGNAAELEKHTAGSNGGDNTGAAGGGNNVVRFQSGGSHIRTQSGSGNHVARMYCP